MAKNQIHALIDMLRDTMVAHNVHDAIAAAALLSLPVLVVLWITNRMRHPERSFLSAVTIAFTGLAVVPFGSLGAAALWVRTGGDFIQAAILAAVLYILGFCMTRSLLRSPPRTRRSHPTPWAAGSPGELSQLRDEVARLRAEKMNREDVA